MALLFITHKFPPGIGGMEKQSYELLNGMSAKAKCYSIIQSPAEPKIWFFLCLWFRVFRMLKRYPDISVLHANDAVVATYCALFIRNKRILKTATFHGLDIVFPNAIFQNFIVPQLIKLDHVFTVSKATAQACLDRGFSLKRISIIKNGVDHEIASVPKDANFSKKLLAEYDIDLAQHTLLLSTGRAVKRKGFSWFMRSVMPRLGKEYRYVVIGPKIRSESGFMRFWPAALKKQWDLFWGKPADSYAVHESVNKDKRCIAIGSVGYQELLQWMQHADAFIMPNQKVDGDMEGFGLVALEAALSGTYVLASGIEGITCAVDSLETGILIDPEDDSAWAQRIKVITQDRKILEQKGRGARKHVLNRFKWSRMVEQYHFVFMHLENESRTVSLNRELLTVQ